MKHCLFLCALELEAESIRNPTTNYPYPRLLKRMSESGEWTITAFAPYRKTSEAVNNNLTIHPWSLRNFIRYGLMQHQNLVVMQLFMKPKWALLAKLWHRVPLVFRTGGISGTVADMARPFYPLRLWRWWFYYSFFDFFVSTADGTPVQLHFFRMGIPRHRYREWPNAFRPVPAGPPRREKVILYVGRLSPVKAVDYLIESFAEATKKLDSGYKLMIYGADARVSYSWHEAELVRLIERLGLVGRVEIHPWTHEAERHIASCKMVVTGCANNQILEAYAAGTPVIALDLGETRNLYSRLENVHIIDYPLGGYPLPSRKRPSIRPEVRGEIVRATAEAMVAIAEAETPPPPVIDFAQYGWEQRLQKELNLYATLLDDPARPRWVRGRIEAKTDRA